MIQSLSETSLFGGFAPQFLADISVFSKKLHLHVGETLIGENDKNGNDLFILCKGDVEVLSNHSGITSGEVVLSKRDVELFGEIRWLLGGGRTASVRCVTDAELIRIDGDALQRYMEDVPKVGFEIMRRVATQLSQRIHHSDILLKQLLWMDEV